MSSKKSRKMRILRWILFLPVAGLAYSIITTVFAITNVALLYEIWWFALLRIALATIGYILIGNIVAPSSRVAIPLLVVILLLGSGGSEIYFLFQFGRIPYVGFLVMLISIFVGIIISTKKGSERTRVLRTLRWILFLPLAAFVGLGITDLLMWLWALFDPNPVIIGIGSAIFLSVAGIIVPSYRLSAILLIATISYLYVFSGYRDYEFIANISDQFYKYILTWAVGTAVGIFVTWRITNGFGKPSRVNLEIKSKKRRYKGTAPYQDLDLDRKTFFGRDHEIRSLVSLVMAEHLVILFAKSGIGKSSLINAGLVGQLRKRVYFPIVVRFNDQTHGLMDLLLAGVRNAAREENVDIVNGDDTNAWWFFKTAEFWSNNNDLLHPVLILDQFEEIFTLHSHEARSEFIGQLGEIVRGRSVASRSGESPTIARQHLDDTPPRLKVVIALREGYLANLEELAKEIPAILRNRFRLGPLNRETARQAIIGPARLSDHVFQTEIFSYKEEAVQRIITFLAKRSSGAEDVESDEVEPVHLQLICQYMEEVVRERQATAKLDSEIEISEADLGDEAQMQRVLKGFYDRTIASIRPRHKARAVRSLCEKRLVSSSGRRLTEAQEEIKNRFKLSDKLLQQLVDARLLRAESRLGRNFYEIGHDRLVGPILQSRRKRLAKQRWIAAATIPLFLTVMISCGSLLNELKARKLNEVNTKLGLLNPNSDFALQSLSNLVRWYDYKPEEIISKIKNTSVLNPSTFVILNMQEQEGQNKVNYNWSYPDKLAVLDHIKKYHHIFITKENAEGMPTLLGSLFFILDSLEESLDGYFKNEAMDLEVAVLNEFKKEYSEKPQGCSDGEGKADSPENAQRDFVTNEMYRCFYPNHQFSSKTAKKPVMVNWFEALAYATYMGKKLPIENQLPPESRGNIATRYIDMLSMHRNKSSWKRGREDLLNRLIGKDGKFFIYLPKDKKEGQKIEKKGEDSLIKGLVEKAVKESPLKKIGK